MNLPTPLRPRLLAGTAAISLIALLTAGATCDSETHHRKASTHDAGADTTSDASADAADGGADAGSSLPDGVAVPLDLTPYLGQAHSQGTSQLYKVQSTDELADGVVVEARPGDWVLENDRVKLFVEGADRAMSPCPWGGDIVDAQYKRPDGSLTKDVTGEICLMVNVGKTFAPDRFDVVRDGADGGPAILAVSGHLELLGFIDISAMANDYAPGILDHVAMDPDADVPADITRYFILQPGDNDVHIVTALKNTGDQPEHLGVGHLMRGGAHGHYFNPLNSLHGWGYTSLGPDNLTGDPLPFVAYAGADGGYAYVPKPDPSLRPSPDALPRGGAQVSISGVSVSLMGRANILQTLLASKRVLESMDGLLHLQPGDVSVIEHWEYFGDTLSSMVDPIYKTLGADTGAVHGTVTDTAGQPVADVLVTAINADDRAMNQTRTAADGTYRMRVPPGDYHLRARLDVRVSPQDATATVATDDDAQADLTLKDAATIHLTIHTPDGTPTPARASIICEGSCPDMPTSQERDVTLDHLPGGFLRIVSVGVSGTADIDVPAGDYRVAVDRGMEWSVWPPTAPDDGGKLVSLTAGDSVDLDAEIAHVVDTSGAISADFHVHGVTSPDSVVRKSNRVLDFMGEGVDVLISTDHDYITDYAPAIAELGATDQIASMCGEEITTPHIGHFNAFPLVRDPDHRRGGALDWSRGADYDMTPAEIFNWIDNQDGDPTNAQVKQINHAGSTIPPLKADVLRGITLADPVTKRMKPTTPDPTTGDTGLWSDDFTAIEVMNGQSMARVWKIMRWWLSMVSRGFTPTATAVTDTHKLYSDLGGSPRTFVFTGPGHDTVATFDKQNFAATSNAHKAIGTNGPFFRVHLENTAGDTAGLGETLASSDGAVTAHVSIDVPEWMHVDTVDIYSNLSADDIVTSPGGVDEDPIPPTSSTPIDWQPTDLVEVATGNETHSHWVKTVDIPMTLSADAYVVVVVRGKDGDTSMFPVIPNANVQPFAFANPIYVDTDGGGYDHPPLAQLAQTPLEPSMLKAAQPTPFKGELTPAELGKFIETVKRRE